MPPLRQPERTCVGCRQRAAKTDLVRVVRSPDGVVRVDPTGRSPGRGAYVHPRLDCMRLAGRSGALARSLRAPLTPSEAGNLMEGLRSAVGERA